MVSRPLAIMSIVPCWKEEGVKKNSPLLLRMLLEVANTAYNTELILHANCQNFVTWLHAAMGVKCCHYFGQPCTKLKSATYNNMRGNAYWASTQDFSLWHNVQIRTYLLLNLIFLHCPHQPPVPEARNLRVIVNSFFFHFSLPIHQV